MPVDGGGGGGSRESGRYGEVEKDLCPTYTGGLTDLKAAVKLTWDLITGTLNHILLYLFNSFANVPK